MAAAYVQQLLIQVLKSTVMFVYCLRKTNATAFSRQMVGVHSVTIVKGFAVMGTQDADMGEDTSTAQTGLLSSSRSTVPKTKGNLD